MYSLHISEWCWGKTGLLISIMTVYLKVSEKNFHKESHIHYSVWAMPGTGGFQTPLIVGY